MSQPLLICLLREIHFKMLVERIPILLWVKWVYLFFFFRQLHSFNLIFGEWYFWTPSNLHPFRSFLTIFGDDTTSQILEIFTIAVLFCILNLVFLGVRLFTIGSLLLVACYISSWILFYYFLVFLLTPHFTHSPTSTLHLLSPLPSRNLMRWVLSIMFIQLHAPNTHKFSLVFAFYYWIIGLGTSVAEFQFYSFLVLSNWLCLLIFWK